MDKKERRTFAVADLKRMIRAADPAAPNEPDDNDNPGTLEGHAAVFNQQANLGFYVEQIAPGAFKGALPKSDVRALFNHDPNCILGRTKSGTLRLTEDETGLFFSLDLPDTTLGQDLLESVERGDIDQCSFAFTVAEDKWETVGGMDYRTILRFDEIFDVSPVTYPAYVQTDLTVASRSLETWKRERPRLIETPDAAILAADARAREIEILEEMNF